MMYVWCIGCIGCIAVPGERDDASKMYCCMRAVRSQSNYVEIEPSASCLSMRASGTHWMCILTP